MWNPGSSRLRSSQWRTKHALGECDETAESETSVLEQQLDFSTVQSQETYATGVKTAKTRRNAKPDDFATPFEIHNHLSTTQQGNLVGWADRAIFLSCQISLAQQYMPSPTVQIRSANAWVRRTHQVADLKLTFLNIPPEQLRFVTHTDYSSKDQDGTGRTQGGYIVGATDPSMLAGHVAQWGRGHPGMEIAQAETRMHVDPCL